MYYGNDLVEKNICFFLYVNIKIVDCNFNNLFFFISFKEGNLSYFLNIDWYIY